MRDLAEPAYPDDDGTADPAVTASLAAYASGEGTFPEALAVVQASRVLVPVVAVLGEVEYDERRLARDKTSDMAAVLLTGRDGRTALLGFTSTAAMRTWNPQARPVSVPCRQAARAALQDGAAALVLDVAGPVSLAVEGEDLRALAEGLELRRVEVDGRRGWGWTRVM